MINKKVILIVLIISVISCIDEKSKAKRIILKPDYESKKTMPAHQVDESFEKFILKFVSDSTFRYERIKFPINGFNSEAENYNMNYSWTKEDWGFYSREDFNYQNDPNIVNDILKKDSLTIVWRLFKENSGYDIRYIFKKEEKKWFLENYSYKNF